MEILLQDKLISELKLVLKDLKLKSPEGCRNVTVFSQDLPDPEDTDGDIVPMSVPYVIVKSYSSQTPADINSDISINIILVLCCWDNDNKFQGYRDLYAIKNKILKRFLSNKFIDRFEADPATSWQLSDDITYPYFFGGLSMTFKTSNIYIEDNKT